MKLGFTLGCHVVLWWVWISFVSSQRRYNENEHFNRLNDVASESTVLGTPVEQSLMNKVPNYKYHREYTIYYNEKMPNITVKLEDVKVLRDEQARFVCASVGNPMPTIRWLINENLNFPKRFVVVEATKLKSVLKLARAESRDNRSRVTCQSTNAMGSVYSYASLTVYKSKADLPVGFPMLKSKSSVIVNEKNSRVVLDCKVNGLPKPRITWFKDSKPVELEYSRLKLLASGSLEINKTLEEDDGAYECMATNEHGSIVSPVIRLMIREDIEGTYRILMKEVSYFAPQIISVPKDQIVAPGSSLSLQCKAVGNPVPQVYWKCGATLLRSHSPNMTKDIGEATVILSDLSDPMLCTCVAKSPKESIEHSIHISIHEFSTTPINIQLSNIMANSVTVSWWSRPPKGENYVYQVSVLNTSNKNSTIRKSTLQMPYSDKLMDKTIGNLSPYTNYSVWVEIIYPDLDYLRSNTLTFVTLELPPSSAPRNVELSAISNQAVAVVWEPPEQANGIITAYNIYYTAYANKALALWNKYTLKIEDRDTTKSRTSILSHLVYNVTYHICVSAQNSAGSGIVTEPYPILVKAGVVQGPKLLRAVPKSSSEIELFWQPLKSRDLIKIRSYRLVYSIKSQPDGRVERIWDYNPTENQISINSLQNNTTYVISLSAITTSGQGMVSTVEARTRDFVTDEVVVIEGRPLNSTSIGVAWTVTKHMRNKDVFYRIQCLDVFPKKVSLDIYIKNDSQFGIDTLGRYNYTINNLKPHTVYEISLNLITRSETGSTFKSKPILTWPKRIPKIRYLHSRLACASQYPCIELTWQPPHDQQSLIEGYRIRLYEIPDDNTRKQVIERNVTTSHFVTNSTQLYQGYTYVFKVAAYSKFEIGEETEGNQTIQEGIPATFPSEFKMKDTDQNIPASARFSWKPLSRRALNGNFDHYVVKCHIVSEENTSQTNHTTKFESIVIGSLLDNQNYSCSICVVNGNAAGPWSAPILFKTKNIYLMPPDNIRMVRLSHSTAHITWSWKIEFPIYYSHFQIDYADEMSGSKRDNWCTIFTKHPVTKFALTQLNVSGLYVMQMRSVPKHGLSGPWSKTIKEISLGPEGIPEKEVSEASCAPETSRDILLHWSTEFDDTRLSHYRVNFTGITKYISDKRLLSSIREAEEQSALSGASRQHWTHRLVNLHPNTQYTINIEPIFLPSSISIGRPAQIICATYKEAPKSISELSLLAINKDLNQIRLTLTRPSSVNGTIDVFFIIVEPHIPDTMSNIIRRRREVFSEDYLGNILSRFKNADKSESNSYVAMSLKGEEIFPMDNSDKITHIVALGSGKTVGNITDRLLNSSFDYKIRVLACIRLLHLKNQSFQCTQSPWTQLISINTSIPPKGSHSLPVGILPNPPSTNGPSTLTMTTIVIILCIVILTVLSLSIFVILKRRSRLKSKLGIMYGSHSTRLSKEKSMCMDNLLKEPLVDQNARISTSESLRFNHLNHNYIETNKPQLSSTPDLLQRSSLNQPLTSVAMFHRHNGRCFDQESIHVDALADHVTKLKENSGKLFSLEYESIEPGQQFTWNVSNLDVNRPKNRYANVIAYDHSRVVLQNLYKRKNSFSNETSVVLGSDYINANYIDGYLKPNAYIATQGPLAETIGDFWRMVWEQNCAVIVMMTRLEERDRTKCDQYWPVGGKGSIGTYSTINVTLIDVNELAYYTIRKFHIQKYGCIDGRDIYQLQFTAWPDHGVPNHPAPLLMFLRRVQAESPKNSRPMIVHCSAGVGRTGAFIVIDYMLEKLHYENRVDICNYVTNIRAQRNYMVQTEEQYIFIHEALLEAVQCGNTEVTVSELTNHIETLNQIEINHRTTDGVQMTGLQMEYEKLLRCSQSFIQGIKANTNNHSICSTPTTTLSSNAITSQPLTFETANIPVNQLKNRIIQMLPPDFSRVNLNPIRGLEGSDYINASWIDGYRSRKAYIAAQAPLANTCEDFWRMLWEQNSSIIVILTRLKENNRERSYQYWPLQTSVRYQFFIVDPIAEYNMTTFVIREFKITDTRDSQSRVIRQFHYTDWRESEGIPESTTALLDVINQVHKTKSQLGLDGPITVHCSAGTGRTGIFIALSNILERMKNESVIDLFQTVKLLRWQRPALIQSEDQYQFCYTAALEYLRIYEQMCFE